MKNMNTYEITFKDPYGDYPNRVIADTPSKARYKLYCETGDLFGYGFMNYLHWIDSCKKVSSFKVSDLFGDEERFDRMKEMRGIEFAYQGMRIEVAGKSGVIVGSNSSLNLDIVFDGTYWTNNCHPWWKTKYFDEYGRLIKEFIE